MYRTIDDFAREWREERSHTLKMLRQLTDASLAQGITPRDRTLGRIGWHLVGTMTEMMGKVGIPLHGPDEQTPPPSRAADIADAYERVSSELLDAIPASWTDDTLRQEDEMYGERWTRAFTLTVLVMHQTHHRGQMTVLMRQAGLTVPGVYGPAREEWAQWGMPEPAV